jgi:hypothetical protein
MTNKKIRRSCDDDVLSYTRMGNKDAYGVLLGVELEYNIPYSSGDTYTEPDANVISYIQSLPNFIVKSDGSLIGGGYEIVSAPLPLRKHKFSPDWYSIFSMVDGSKDIVRNSDCGLHIHVNADSGIDWKKSRCLIYSNPSFIFSRFAKRKPSSYAFVDKYTHGGFSGDDDNIEYDDFGDPISSSEDRYHAVNTQGNGGKTIEFRMFASTKNITRLFRALEFCHSMAVYTKTCPMSPYIKPYFDFVSQHPTLYPSVIGAFYVNGVLDLPVKPEVGLLDI